MKVISLNIEGDRHLNQRVLPFLRSSKADLFCLQEVYQADVQQIVESLGGQTYIFQALYNITNQNRWQINPRGPWGLLVVSQKPHTKFTRFCYNLGDSVDVEQPPDLIRQTACQRWVLMSETQDENGKTYRVATTHFTWSAGGESTALQLADARELKSWLSDWPDFVLMGDLNAPRSGETFRLISQSLRDWLPASIESTLDPNLHYAAPLKLVVDACLTTANYQATNLEVICGVSDHCAIVTNLERTD